MLKSILDFPKPKPINLPGFGPFKPKPKGRKPIGKPLRDQVWLKYMGNKAQGKCYCCKIRMIHVTDFHVGHNKAVAKGGKNNIHNLRPICGPCNRGMGTKSIEWYRKKYFSKGGKKKSIKKSGTRKSPRKPTNPWGFQQFKI